MVRKDVNQINITMSREKYMILQEAWKASQSDKKISGWILDSIIMMVEKDEFLKSYAPYLSKKMVDGNSIIIKDDKIGRLVEVTRHDERFWCDVDEGECCVHIHFAHALPELAKIK